MGSKNLRSNEAVLWRGAGEVQVGVDARVVLSGLTPAEQNLLLDLSGRIAPEWAVPACERHQVQPQRWEELRDAILPGPPPPAPVTGSVLLLDGSPLTRQVGLQLGAMGGPSVRTVADRLRSLPDVAVLTDAWVTDPHRIAPLMRHDVPHLPLVVRQDGVRVGPVVIPGRTACTVCADLARTDSDPAWPALATQLRVLPSPAPPRWRMDAAAVLATDCVARVLSGVPAGGWWVGDRLEPLGLQPHPECTCLGITPLSGAGPVPV